MKKKITILITVFLLVALVGATVAYASEESDSNLADFFKSRLDFKRSQLNEAKERGDITEEEAKIWSKHFDDMEKFHAENGFPQFCRGFRGQRVTPYGQNQGYGQRFGRGMMGRYYNREL